MQEKKRSSSKEERTQEKNRTARKKRRKYGKAGYRHSKQGVYSCIFAIAGFLILAGCIACSYLLRGKAPGILGGIGLIAPILALAGIRSALRGFHERERKYRTCKIGLVADSLVLVLFLIIFVGGMNI